LNIERKTIFLVAIIGTIFGVGVMANQSSLAESPNAIKFHDYSILGPQASSDGIPILKPGQQAIITVNIEKVIDTPVEDVSVKAYLTKSQNGKYLLMPKSTVYAGFKMTDSQLLLNDAAGIREQLYQKQDITEVIMFQVIAIDSRAEPLEDTVEVVLFADEEEMDRLSFDVIVKSKGL
jgi:hypothetical protein